MKTLEVTAAIIQQDDKILICQRPVNKNCALLWEFPGGKIETNETGEQCIVRECQEELGITIYVKREISNITYEYPDRLVHLHFYLCNITAGVPEKKEHNALAWISPDEVKKYKFCPADQEMISKTNLFNQQL